MTLTTVPTSQAILASNALSSCLVLAGAGACLDTGDPCDRPSVGQLLAQIAYGFATVTPSHRGLGSGVPQAVGLPLPPHWRTSRQWHPTQPWYTQMKTILGRRQASPLPRTGYILMVRLGLLPSHRPGELRSAASAGSGDSRERGARSNFEPNSIDPGRLTERTGQLSASKRGTNFRKVLRSINFSPPQAFDENGVH